MALLVACADGEKAKLSLATNIRLKLDGSEYVESALGKELQRFRYSLLPSGIIRFERKDFYFLGRYELKGHKLKLCFPGPLEVGKQPQPPAGFESKKGTMATLSTCDREE